MGVREYECVCANRYGIVAAEDRRGVCVCVCVCVCVFVSIDPFGVSFLQLRASVSV